jgi:hypothetical protein
VGGLDRVRPLEVRRFLADLRTTDSAKTGRALSSYTLHGCAQVILLADRYDEESAEERDIEEWVKLDK